MSEWKASVRDQRVTIDGTDYEVPGDVVALLLHNSHQRHRAADIGRELYEALKTVLGGKAPADPSVSEALTRYEREVGS